MKWKKQTAENLTFSKIKKKAFNSILDLLKRDTKDSTKRQKTQPGTNDSTKSTKDSTKGHKRLNKETILQKCT